MHTMHQGHALVHSFLEEFYCQTTLAYLHVACPLRVRISNDPDSIHTCNTIWQALIMFGDSGWVLVTSNGRSTMGTQARYSHQCFVRIRRMGSAFSANPMVCKLLYNITPIFVWCINYLTLYIGDIHSCMRET